MNPHWTESGQNLTGPSGILELMDDLGNAIGRDDLCMLGGGNPAAIPELQAIWRERMRELLDHDTAGFDRMLNNYDTPIGRPAFIEALAGHLRRRYDWDIGPGNIAVTNGTQNGLFHLFNAIAEPDRPVLLPLCPEYIGYADLGLRGPSFVARRPAIELRGDHDFKYGIDFDALGLEGKPNEFAAVCLSRPTNPSGNVVTNAELARLSEQAAAAETPIVVDNAYGAPFPGIVFSDIEPTWDHNTILSLSLSKFGLPGTRTGILIADESVIQGMRAANAIANLATGNIGQELVTPLLESDRITELCRDVVRPFYESRAKQADLWLREAMDPNLPWRLHACEGSMFFWLWCDGLPISSAELYQRLKARGVLVVTGHYFFFGLGASGADWPHQHECLRIHAAMPPDITQRGLGIIAEEVAKAYAG